MQWYNIKEKSAGKYRLLACYYLYKILGKNIVYFIAFFVAFFTYIANEDIKKCSKNYFKILYEYTKNKKLKPSFLNSFKRVLFYSYSLVDKMEAYMQKFKSDNIEFIDENDKEILLKDIEEKGVFFICNHIGNVDIMRSLFSNENYSHKTEISVFLQQNHCRIFNDFINSLKINIEKIKIYPIEEIDLSSANILDESLKKGGIAFMAGDRVSSKNEENNEEMDFLNKKIKIPNGVFRFAKLMQTNIYFISCVKEKNKYLIYLKKADDSSIHQLHKEYTEFLEKITLLFPHQFYHFYEFFI